jgi:hypothetical protein
MSNKVANHLHRYKKVNLSRKKDEKYYVYRCTKPACTHYVPLHLAEGKLCECNRCGEPIVLGKFQLQGSPNQALTLPHCVDCTKRRKTDVEMVATLANFLEEKGQPE